MGFVICYCCTLLINSVAFVIRTARIDSLPAMLTPYDIDTLMSRTHLDLRGVMTAPNAGAPADTLPPVENSGIDFPCLIVWTIMHQAIAFLHLLLTIHLNTYPLLIRTSSAEAPGTDDPSVVLLPSPPTL